MAEPETAEDWSAPKHDPETGVAMHGDYPFNSRLRAEALATAGKAEDPNGLIPPELIVDAAGRLERAAAAAEKAAREAPSVKWSEKRLRDEAARLGLVVETDANKPAIVAAIEGATAPQTEA